MSKLNELYLKVLADSSLQAKFLEIVKDVETVGHEVTGEKLVVFAKEAGYDVTVAEIAAFLKNLAPQQG
ncbi:Nif11 family protein [Bacillus sp. V3B]|uniref:Nif11 family protein n=1 Tax=Bacillus sp. V3B TaxID=2804915 RepID=UPI00210DCAC6|nr:Nif11 family protein [Bacillus sp. V3B]MCQ6274749.1 Nif11 family protein [Bacillus sp. V3B]